VPFLTIAATFTCFNQFFNSIYVVYKRSTNSLYTMLAGAIANCIMNYFFIVWWGPIGATYASFLGLFLVFVLRAINTRGLLVVDFSPVRLGVNLAMLLCEAALLLCEVPLYGLWTGLVTAVVILFNFKGVWAMMRVLLPKVLGRVGRTIAATGDRLLRYTGA
jgi:O-antigen/teichoic acid export membrane protein